MDRKELINFLLDLSPTEREFLFWHCRNRRKRQIMGLMLIQPGTYDTHLRNIAHKLPPPHSSTRLKDEVCEEFRILFPEERDFFVIEKTDLGEHREPDNNKWADITIAYDIELKQIEGTEKEAEDKEKAEKEEEVEEVEDELEPDEPEEEIDEEEEQEEEEETQILTPREEDEIEKSLEQKLSFLDDKFEEDEEEEKSTEEEIGEETKKEEDSGFIDPDHRRKGQEPPPPPEQIETPPREFPWLRVIIIVVLLASGAYLVNWIVNRETTLTPDDIRATLNARATIIAGIPTLTPTEVTPTVTPNEVTPTPAITPTPAQPSPTPEPTLSPTPYWIFKDDFDNGVSRDWQRIYGDYYTIDGRIATDNVAMLAIGENSWDDYQIAFDVSNHECALDRPFNALAVRMTEESHMLVMHYSGCGLRWLTVKNGEWEEISGSNVYDFDAYKLRNLRVVVKGNTISSYIENELVKQISVEGYSTGKIALILHKSDPFQSSVDNFTVSELPP